jgi:3'-5' exoribonuclease
VNEDLLIAATLLHDLGKIREFEYETAIKYSDEGRLIGHIVIGIEMLRDRIRTIGGIDPLKETLLVHTILAHHGEMEWGSPKRPMTLEALILHYADLVDSRLSTYIEHRELLDDQPDRRWSDYLPIFERSMYLPPAEKHGETDDDNDEE